MVHSDPFFSNAAHHNKSPAAGVDGGTKGVGPEREAHADDSSQCPE